MHVVRGCSCLWESWRRGWNSRGKDTKTCEGSTVTAHSTHPSAIRALPAEADAVTPLVAIIAHTDTAIVDDCGGVRRFEVRGGVRSRPGVMALNHASSRALRV